MEKQQIVATLKNARVSHISWVNNAIKLLEGNDLEYVNAPVECGECDFGNWLSKQSSHLSNIPGFEEIERFHYDFHVAYEILYYSAPIAHEPKKIFESAIKQKRKLEKLRKEYKRLEKIAINLILKMDMVEKMVSTMSDRLFERTMVRVDVEPA